METNKEWGKVRSCSGVRVILMNRLKKMKLKARDLKMSRHFDWRGGDTGSYTRQCKTTIHDERCMSRALLFPHLSSCSSWLKYFVSTQSKCHYLPFPSTTALYTWSLSTKSSSLTKWAKFKRETLDHHHHRQNGVCLQDREEDQETWRRLPGSLAGLRSERKPVAKSQSHPKTRAKSWSQQIFRLRHKRRIIWDNFHFGLKNNLFYL